MSRAEIYGVTEVTLQRFSRIESRRDCPVIEVVEFTANWYTLREGRNRNALEFVSDVVCGRLTVDCSTQGKDYLCHVLGCNTVA